MNKNGSIFNVFGMFFALVIVIIVAFIFVMMSATFMNGFSTITDKLIEIPEGSPSSPNISGASQKTFGNFNSALQQLRWVSFVVIIGMFAGILISGYMVRVHQGWFIFYVLFSVIAIMMSIYIANSYEALTQTASLGVTLQQFKATSFIMRNLHIWTTVISFIGAILMFVGISRDQETGGLL